MLDHNGLYRYCDVDTTYKILWKSACYNSLHADVVYGDDVDEVAKGVFIFAIFIKVDWVTSNIGVPKLIPTHHLYHNNWFGDRTCYVI